MKRLAILLLVLVPAAPLPAAEKSAAPPDAVAMVGGVAIPASRLEDEIRGQLLEMRMREYTLRSRALDDIIAKMLVEKEASARGVTLTELLKVEVDDKVTVAEADARSFYEANKQRFKDAPEAEALKQATSQLKQQRGRDRRVAFVKELREKVGVKILLEPVRVAVTAGTSPAKGPAEAPVTIIEFSDFQCPYCARVLPALKRVEETYKERVRFVFRDFPLQIHPLAPKAAEAGACANDQGKFWEMHDRLFQDQAKLQVVDLKQHAAAMGLDSAKFDECLDTGRHAADWQRNLQEGTGYGVSGTPAFFINGRLLVGAQPYEAFVQVIDEELERAAAKKKPGPS